MAYCNLLVICAILAQLMQILCAGPVYWINKNNLKPESMKYYDGYGFLTGSMGYGTIFQMEVNSTSMMNGNPMNFSAVPFYENENLTFSAGFALDTDRNVLFICRADPTTFVSGLTQDPAPDNWTLGYMAGVHIVDMDTQTVIADYDLQDYNVDNDDPMYHLCNDIVIDSSGNAYVTDSFGGAIYKLTNNGATYDLSIFSYTSKWQDPGYIFFDGLSLDPVNEDFILVNGWINTDVDMFSSPFFSGDSVMIKIPLDTPMQPYMVNYTNVKTLDHGFDGQVMTSDGMYLYVTGDMTQSVYQFTSEDNWDTMTLNQVQTTQNREPTAIALASNGPFGTGIMESVFASSAFFTSGALPAYPIELLDFTMGTEYLFPNATCGGVIDEERPVLWIEKSNLKPETMRYYDDYGFLTGSMGYGTIFQMIPSTTSNMTGNPLNFTVEEFYSNDILNFSAGFAIDLERDILFICHANIKTFGSGLFQSPAPDNWTYGFMGGVMIVDLSTNKMIANFDLQDYNVDPDDPFYHLANDIIIDSSGNAYVTDSFGGAIYKITYDSNNSTMPYSMGLFSYTSEWQVPGYIFFDGLSMDPVNGEFILVNGWINNDIDNSLSPFFGGYSVMIKIPMDTPMKPKMCNYSNVVELDRGFDGQIFSDDGMYLYVTGDMASAVYRFTSEDNWDTLTLEQVKTTQSVEPTAIALAANGPYGTGVDESVYVSSAFFTFDAKPAYPIELLDFSNSDSIVVAAFEIEVEIPINSYSLDDKLYYMKKDFLLPETMRYYSQNDLGFLTGSMGYGTIFQMVSNTTSSSNSSNPLNFTAKPFFSNDNLVFSAGFEIDFSRNVLFICHADKKTFSYGLGQNKTTNWTNRYMGGVMIVNMTTMDVIANFDFQDYNVNASNPMYHLANDIIVDESDGSAYVTDSFGGAIYKISYDSSSSTPYSVSIFSYTAQWQIPKYIFFDGLSMDPVNGDFILANAWINTDTTMYSSPFFSGTSVMIKIPLDEPMKPKMCNYTNIVSLDRGFDGQIFSDDGTYLYVTGDRSQSVYRFTSTDNWDSLTLESVRMTQYDEPTAIAFARDGPYGVGLDEVVFVSSAFFTHPESYYPIELIDFRRSVITNNTINNNGTNNSTGNGSSSSNKDTISKDVFYALIGVISALALIVIILVICIFRLRNKEPSMSSNIDYHKM
eukprot:CAMPEP_0201595284 /NCGR_PEP_ID=MMETSP0190_2-20130828/192335_1 /ASSEMBLY_ACC=CAM_ASM_000263 /TAXON_ID=37353 /ORGANISM="Rosalina sp." /LENGTH=1175 /DNA_ID=CAMNT_0048055211 /DNA_START=8 /DNA_END=3535 /DNA_ORIENTATION=-